MNDIRIVRLKSGEDIIGSICTKDEFIEMAEPMTVDIVHNRGENGLVMSHWLPVQLIKKNEIILNKNDILTTFEPNDEFCEYYSNTVRKIASLLKAKEIADKLTEEEAEGIMEALEQGDGETIH